MGKVSNGKRFEHDFSRSLSRLQGFSLRLIDGADLTKCKMPGDFLFWANTGESYLIECKATSRRSFPASQLKSHQLESLLIFENIAPNTGSFIAINFYGENLAKENRCIVIPAWKYAVYFSKTARKSIPIEDALEIGIECPRIIGSVWNLQQAFEGAAR